MADENALILIAGMHRSGTSATASVTQALGAELGAPLHAADNSNSAGYFELAPAVHAHDALLRTLGQTWDDPRPVDLERLNPTQRTQARERLVGVVQEHLPPEGIRVVKDPRASRLIPIWVEVFDELGLEPRFIHVCRNPAQVAVSLHNRSGMSTQLADALWLGHNASMIRDTSGLLNTVIHFDSLVADPVGVMSEAEKRLKITWPCPPKRERSSLAELLDGSLIHNRSFGGSSESSDERVAKMHADMREMGHRPASAAAERIAVADTGVAGSLPSAHYAAHRDGVRQEKLQQLASRVGANANQLKKLQAMHEADAAEDRKIIEDLRSQVTALAAELDRLKNFTELDENNGSS